MHAYFYANTDRYELVPEDDTPGKALYQLWISVVLWITCGLLCTGCAQGVDERWNTCAQYPHTLF